VPDCIAQMSRILLLARIYEARAGVCYSRRAWWFAAEAHLPDASGKRAAGFGGGAVGCAIAWGLLRTFIALAPDGTIRLREEPLLFARLRLHPDTTRSAQHCYSGLVRSLDRLRIETLGRARVAGRTTSMRQVLITSQLSVSLILLTRSGAALIAYGELKVLRSGLTGTHCTASFSCEAFVTPMTAVTEFLQSTWKAS